MVVPERRQYLAVLERGHTAKNIHGDLLSLENPPGTIEVLANNRWVIGKDPRER